MTKPEMVQSKNYDKTLSTATKLDLGKYKTVAHLVGSIENFADHIDESKLSAVKPDDSVYKKPEPPNVIRYQKFYPSFTSSVQDFRGLQMFPPTEYAFSNFQPRTTEKGILEPKPIYETVNYDSGQFKCDNQCLAGRGTQDNLMRSYGMKSLSQGTCIQRHFSDKVNGKTGAYTLPRKSNQMKKSKNVPQNYFHHRVNVKQSCDGRSPFKIAQSEHYSLLNSQQMNYNNTMQFTNHPFGAFQLIQSLPRAYISESQAVTKKEPSYVQSFGDISNQLPKLETKALTQQLFAINPYKTVMLPFEINDRSGGQDHQLPVIGKERGTVCTKGSEWLRKESVNNVFTRKNSSSSSDQIHGLSKKTITRNVAMGDIYVPPVDLSVIQNNEMTDDCL